MESASVAGRNRSNSTNDASPLESRSDDTLLQGRFRSSSTRSELIDIPSSDALPATSFTPPAKAPSSQRQQPDKATLLARMQHRRHGSASAEELRNAVNGPSPVATPPLAAATRLLAADAAERITIDNSTSFSSESVAKQTTSKPLPKMSFLHRQRDQLKARAAQGAAASSVFAPRSPAGSSAPPIATATASPLSLAALRSGTPKEARSPSPPAVASTPTIKVASADDPDESAGDASADDAPKSTSAPPASVQRAPSVQKISRAKSNDAAGDALVSPTSPTSSSGFPKLRATASSEGSSSDWKNSMQMRRQAWTKTMAIDEEPILLPTPIEDARGARSRANSATSAGSSTLSDGLGGANSWGEPARLTSRLSSDSKSTSETGPGPESLVVLLTEEVETVVTESSAFVTDTMEKFAASEENYNALRERAHTMLDKYQHQASVVTSMLANVNGAHDRLGRETTTLQDQLDQAMRVGEQNLSSATHLHEVLQQLRSEQHAENFVDIFYLFLSWVLNVLAVVIWAVLRLARLAKMLFSREKAQALNQEVISVEAAEWRARISSMLLPGSASNPGTPTATTPAPSPPPSGAPRQLMRGRSAASLLEVPLQPRGSLTRQSISSASGDAAKPRAFTRPLSSYSLVDAAAESPPNSPRYRGGGMTSMFSRSQSSIISPTRGESDDDEPREAPETPFEDATG